MSYRLRTAAPALLLAVIASLAMAASASASKGQVTILDASNELNGAAPEATRERAFDELASLGADVVRFQVYWRFLVPSPDSATPPAGFNPRDPLTYGQGGANWAPVDRVVQGAAEHGMQVSLVLTGLPPTGKVPRWASRDPNGSVSNPDPAAFRDFAYAVGLRYGGGAGSRGLAQYVSIWNEPNSPVFLRAAPGQSEGVVASLYRELVIAGQTGLAEAGWPGKLLIGEIGPTQLNKLSRPVPFLRTTLCLSKRNKLGAGCQALDIDGIAHHPYSFGRAPYEPALNSGQVSIANLRVLLKLEAKAKTAGAIPRDAALYNTEYGYPSRPESRTGVSRKTQAEYASIAEYITWNIPGVASFAQYLVRDDPPGTLSSGFASGLCPHDAPAILATGGDGCKPALGAFRTSLVVRTRGAAHCDRTGKEKRRRTASCLKRAERGPVTIWGHVRPPTAPTTALIRFRDPGGAPHALRAVRTDASGYFQTPARAKPGRRWSVTWNGQRGPFIRAHAF